MLRLPSKTRLPILLLLVVLLTASVMLSTEAGVLGSWTCVTADTPLGELTWAMTIKDDGGKLAGTFSCDELGTFRLSDLSLEGDTFVFFFYPVGNHVEVKAKLQQEKLAGTWQIEGGPGGGFSAERDASGTDNPASQ